MQISAELKSRGRELRSQLQAITAIADPTDNDLSKGEAIASELRKIDRMIGIQTEEERQQELDAPHKPRAGACDYDPAGETRTAHAAGPVFVRSGSEIADPALDQGPIETNDAFYRAATSKQFDPRLQAYEQRATQLYDLPNAGLLVPESSTSNIFDKAIEDSVFWPNVTTYPIRNARSIVIPAFNDSDHSDGTLWGGVQMYWEGEASELTESSGEVREMRLEVKGLKGYTTLSNELKEASPDFASIIERKLGQALSWKIDDAILRGDGAGKPLGILNAPCTIEADKADGQANDTIIWANIKDMYSRMLPRSRQRATWFSNNDLVPQLLELTIPIGTAGDRIPVMRESDGQFTILGRPVVFTEKCSALGDVGDIIFADLSFYAVGMLGAIAIAQSEHAFFKYDKHAIRSTCYLDGAPLLDSEFTPYKGTNTLSPFVTLEAR